MKLTRLIAGSSSPITSYDRSHQTSLHARHSSISICGVIGFRKFPSPSVDWTNRVLRSNSKLTNGQIFGLPQLEILDLSRNYLSNIPEDICNLKALRVFSIHHNHIEDLPQCLAYISTLRVLKLRENPFKPELRDVIIGYENSLSPSTPALQTDENENDMIITARVVDYLRQKQHMNEKYG